MRSVGAACVGAHEEAACWVFTTSSKWVYSVCVPLSEGGTAEVLGSGVSPFSYWFLVVMWYFCVFVENCVDGMQWWVQCDKEIYHIY